MTKADVGTRQHQLTANIINSCGTGPCLNGSRTLYCPADASILYALPILWCPMSLSHHAFSAWKALMSQFWLVNKNPYIFSIQRTLNQPAFPATGFRCKRSQQLAKVDTIGNQRKNVEAYNVVVWPILVSSSLLPTQLCPCCSTKMNWPSTLLLASFQQMLIILCRALPWEALSTWIRNAALCRGPQNQLVRADMGRLMVIS